jgi:hypothetical protein
MTLVASAAVAFGCGAIFDVINVIFISSANTDRAFKAANLSAVLGFWGLCGYIDVSHASHPKTVGAFMIAGYWLGTFVGIKLRTWWRDRQPLPVWQRRQTWTTDLDPMALPRPTTRTFPATEELAAEWAQEAAWNKKS